MLNRGEKGPMVFEPDFLEIAPGDRVRFVPTHKSHNAATIDGMVPEGVEGFKSRINEEFETGFEQPGFYGIKCSPHYGMGMVMLIKAVSYTHLRAHETRHDLVCRLLLEKKKYTSPSPRDKRQSRMPSSA